MVISLSGSAANLREQCPGYLLFLSGARRADGSAALQARPVSHSTFRAAAPGGRVRGMACLQGVQRAQGDHARSAARLGADPSGKSGKEAIWIGALMILVHAGIDIYAILPWLALIALTVALSNLMVSPGQTMKAHEEIAGGCFDCH